jgi:site-specific DNA recombinase
MSTQQAKLEAYCLVKDGMLVEVFSDPGAGGKPLKRPGREQGLAMVEARRVEVVIVDTLDRLTRSVSDRDQVARLVVWAIVRRTPPQWDRRSA